MLPLGRRISYCRRLMPLYHITHASLGLSHHRTAASRRIIPPRCSFHVLVAVLAYHSSNIEGQLHLRWSLEWSFRMLFAWNLFTCADRGNTGRFVTPATHVYGKKDRRSLRFPRTTFLLSSSRLAHHLDVVSFVAHINWGFLAS